MWLKGESRDGFFLWEMAVALSLVLFFLTITTGFQGNWYKLSLENQKQTLELERAIKILEMKSDDGATQVLVAPTSLEEELSFLFEKNISLPECVCRRVEIGSICLVGP